MCSPRWSAPASLWIWTVCTRWRRISPTRSPGPQDDAYDAIGGEQINLGSPKQPQVVLFDTLGMPKTKRTKTGWTTDAEALADLFTKTEHPFLGRCFGTGTRRGCG